MQGINNKLAGILDTLAEQNVRIIGLLTDIKINTRY